MAKSKEFYYATGRRKTAIAKVKLVKGTGKTLTDLEKLKDILTNSRKRR